MEFGWRYLEDGRAIGPLSTAEILRRIGERQDQPHYVWKAGMSEWRDARALPQFLPQSRVFHESPATPEKVGDTNAEPARHTQIIKRARHELLSYLAVSGYLLIWFSAVMFYKSTILGSVGVQFAPFGFAAVKALILGKFILLLEALKIGERKQDGRVLALEILKEALLFTAILFLLSIVEELIVGHFHGREAREVLREIGGGTVPQAIATAVLMFLVLLPYLAFRRLALAHGELPELLFKRRRSHEQR
jgi:hypothetical protein